MRALITALALLTAAPAMAESYAATFKVYFGGIRVGILDLAMEEAEGRYSATSAMRSTGVVGAFYTVDYTASAEGSASDPLFPAQFNSDAAFGEDRQVLEITYSDDAPATVTSDPPYKERTWQIEPTAQVGAADPLSVALTLVRPRAETDLCDRNAEMFDGRRRVRITLGAPAMMEDGTMRCAAKFIRVAGYKPKDMAKATEFPFRVYYDEAADGMWRLKQIVVPSDWGTGVLNRVD